MKTQCNEGGGGILLGDSTGGGAVTLRSVRVHDVRLGKTFIVIIFNI